MFLEKPAFSPELKTLGEAEKRVSSLLKKRHWKKFSYPSEIHGVSSSHAHGLIFYVPYWFFSYDVYEHMEGKTKVLSGGLNALNAFSNELDEGVCSLATREGAEKSREVHSEDNARVLFPRISGDEAREIITVRLASGEKTSKDNVIVSGLELFYVPIWLIEVDLGQKHVSLRVNAVNGKIANEEAIPVREKGFAELTREMLEELSTPSGWIEYSGALVSSFSRKITGSGKRSAHVGGHGGGGGHGKGTSHSESPRAGKLFPEKLSGDDTLVLALAAIAIIVILAVIYVL